VLLPATVATGLVAAAGAGTVALLRDLDRRERWQRSMRVYRLTARRAAHWGMVKVRGAGKDDAARAKLEAQFAIRSAEDVARELGNMKGAIMKAGQMLSFIADGLPREAQAALATLQADVPPMAPSLAEQVVTDELGAPPGRLFLDWDPVPVAAASIGQVHKAVLPDGRFVAIKVQYPGVDRAIKGDLDNAETMYGLFASFAMKNLDVKGLVDELRARMADELDYRIEALHQAEFAARYADHPFIRVPGVVPELSSQRVLTTEWVDGMTWAEFQAAATEESRQRAGEILFRFAQGSIHHHGVFNGDPHPGNYKFHPDGSVTFLDFGLVKRWTPGELESLKPILDAILARDPQGTADAMVAAGFLRPDAGITPERVWEFCSTPYKPYLDDEFSFTRRFVSATIATMIDINGEYGDVIRALNMPPSYVILDRVVWGVSALLGRLHASNKWRGMLDEYRHDGPPVSELGRIEAAWRTGYEA
jgi:predicted unusual protein kinase regulating ubiquinone biosynthesis (AarF/ABC1/UbiB family)